MMETVEAQPWRGSGGETSRGGRAGAFGCVSRVVGTATVADITKEAHNYTRGRSWHLSARQRHATTLTSDITGMDEARVANYGGGSGYRFRFWMLVRVVVAWLPWHKDDRDGNSLCSDFPSLCFFRLFYRRCVIFMMV
ncbi:DNA topoisomerase III [Sesbania bispinosa]|nr:DNA topoisomerase III [Sesbania bispinosa]